MPVADQDGGKPYGEGDPEDAGGEHPGQTHDQHQGAQPGEQPRVDILGARQSIDMLSVLVEKTKGNLTDKEQRLLQNALFELRMMFMEITNAISASAHNASAKPPVR